STCRWIWSMNAPVHARPIAASRKSAVPDRHADAMLTPSMRSPRKSSSSAGSLNLRLRQWADPSTTEYPMRHLLTMDALSRDAFGSLLDAAQALRPHALGRSPHRPLRGMTVANLFFEPSTRTRASFQLAAQR